MSQKKSKRLSYPDLLKRIDRLERQLFPEWFPTEPTNYVQVFHKVEWLEDFTKDVAAARYRKQLEKIMYFGPES